MMIAERYRVLRELGQGGVGQAFEVFDERDARTLALKRLVHHEGARGEKQQLLFRNEYSILAQFEHPNVVRVYDFGIDEGLPF
jgi:serine/threonine protein kinase